jgi:hypothetical protein
MKKKSFLFILVFICFNCHHVNRQPFEVPPFADIATMQVTEAENSAVINVEKFHESINASDLIADFKYIPLETNKNSLIGYYNKILIHDEKIYIMDDLSAQAIFIFDMQGRFLEKISKKGGAPNEFYQLAGMSIDKKEKQLLAYDNRKRVMMYYTLDGRFIRRENMPFSFYGSFAVLPSSGMTVSATNKSNRNTHLENLDDYRLIYTDSVGTIKKTAFECDDNVDLPISWSQIIENGEELLYYPQFQNKLYQITDSTVNIKYEIKLNADFNQYNPDRLLSFRNLETFNNYWNSTTKLDTRMAENTNHLYFMVSDKKERVFCFYDKLTKNLIATKDIAFDEDWIIRFSVIYAYNDLFIATVDPGLIKALKQVDIENGKNKLSQEAKDMIDSLEEDDNSVLVLFKLKNF